MRRADARPLIILVVYWRLTQVKWLNIGCALKVKKAGRRMLIASLLLAKQQLQPTAAWHSGPHDADDFEKTTRDPRETRFQQEFLLQYDLYSLFEDKAISIKYTCCVRMLQNKLIQHD